VISLYISAKNKKKTISDATLFALTIIERAAPVSTATCGNVMLNPFDCDYCFTSKSLGISVNN
jgi:hypothetical protein